MFAEFFYLFGGGHGVLSYFFVEFLSVSACFYCGHHDIFGGHEWQFSSDSCGDYLWINDKAACDVDENFEDSVDGQESFGDDNSAVGRIVEGSFEPLLRGGHCGAGGEAENQPAKCGGSFASHWVSFVGHCGGTDL